MLKQERDSLFEQIHQFVQGQEQNFKTISKEVLLKERRNVGDGTEFEDPTLHKRGFIDMDRQVERKSVFDVPEGAGPSERRFENTNLLPSVASKYRRSNQTVLLEKLTERNLDHMIKKTNGKMVGAELLQQPNQIKGSVRFSRQTNRKDLVKRDPCNLDGAQPSIYTYADGIKRALLRV